MKNSLLILLLLLGLTCQVFGQTPAKGFEGSWQGTLEAGEQKLRLVVTVTKSDAGVYAGKLDSLDQGATIAIDTITVNGAMPPSFSSSAPARCRACFSASATMASSQLFSMIRGGCCSRPGPVVSFVLCFSLKCMLAIKS